MPDSAQTDAPADTSADAPDDASTGEASPQDVPTEAAAVSEETAADSLAPTVTARAANEALDSVAATSSVSPGPGHMEFAPANRGSSEQSAKRVPIKTCPAAASLAVRASLGPNAPLPSHDVTLQFHDYQTINCLKKKGESEAEVVARAIRWLDTLDMLWNITDTSQERFTLEELRKVTASRYQMNRAGYDDLKIAAIVRACFCDQTEEDLSEAFDCFDATQSGSISKDELREAMPFLGENIQEADINKLFELVDRDGTGEIDFEEFCTLVKAMHPKDGQTDLSAALSGMFSNAAEGAGGWLSSSADGVGTGGTFSALSSGASLNVSILSMRQAGLAMDRMKQAGAKDERAAALCEAFYSDQSTEQLRRSFDLLDADQSGCLDKGELKQLLPLLEETPEDQIDDLFKAIDKDGSGKLEFKEFQMLMKALAGHHQDEGWTAGIDEAWGKISSGWFS